MLGFYRCVCICKEIKSVVQLPVVVIVCYRRCLSLKLRVSGSVCDWMLILLGLWVTRWHSAHVNQSVCKCESKWLHSLSSSGQTYFSLSYWTSTLTFSLPLSPCLSLLLCLSRSVYFRLHHSLSLPVLLSSSVSFVPSPRPHFSSLNLTSLHFLLSLSLSGSESLYQSALGCFSGGSPL